MNERLAGKIALRTAAINEFVLASGLPPFGCKLIHPFDIRSFASNKTGSAIVSGPREALAAQAKNVYIRRN